MQARKPTALEYHCWLLLWRNERQSVSEDLLPCLQVPQQEATICEVCTDTPKSPAQLCVVAFLQLLPLLKCKLSGSVMLLMF